MFKSRFTAAAVLIAAVAMSTSMAARAAIVYSSSFEGTDGGWTATNDWERGSIAFSATGCDGGGSGPSAAYDGTEVWGTVLDGCYRNLGNQSTLSQMFDLSGFTNASLNWYQFVEVFYSFDRAEVYVNNDLLYERTTSSPTADWELQSIDLSSYVGGTANIVYRLFASSVVNRPGWYVDSVNIEANAVPVPPTAFLLIAGLIAVGQWRRSIG